MFYEGSGERASLSAKYQRKTKHIPVYSTYTGFFVFSQKKNIAKKSNKKVAIRWQSKTVQKMPPI